MTSPAGPHRRSPIALPSRPIQTSAQSRQIPMNPSICSRLRKATLVRMCRAHCAFPPQAALDWLNLCSWSLVLSYQQAANVQVTEPAIYPDFLCAKDLEVITRDGQRSVTGAAGAAHRPRRCVLRVAHGPAKGSTGSSRERRSPSSLLPSRSHPHHRDLGRIPTDPYEHCHLPQRSDS